MESVGRPQAAAEPYPEDPYTKVRDARMSRETGSDPSVYRGSKQTPIKRFVEAKLGKFSRNPEQLERFLKHDRKVLRFNGTWDDRDSMCVVPKRIGC